MQTRTAFNPIPMAANATQEITGSTVAGFLPKTAGTLSVLGKRADGLGGAVTFVDAIPVSAGVYVNLPLAFPSPGGSVVLGGGASGTLFV